jgi:hypothetical protein
MLMERIIAAVTFRSGVYKQAAADTGFTQEAWMIVAVSQILSNLGTRADQLRSGKVVEWLVGAMVGAALGIGAFALTAYLIPIIARELFRANTSFEKMVRSLGLANVWSAVGIVGIIGVIPFLGCVFGPIALIAGLAGLAAYLIAVKETSEMDWAGTIVTVIAAAVIQLMAALIAGGVLAIFGIGAALMMN